MAYPPSARTSRPAPMRPALFRSEVSPQANQMWRPLPPVSTHQVVPQLAMGCCELLEAVEASIGRIDIEYPNACILSP